MFPATAPLSMWLVIRGVCGLLGSMISGEVTAHAAIHSRLSCSPATLLPATSLDEAKN